MIETLVNLFVNFFYIGAFSFGGGYAMMPLIQDVVTKYGWMSEKGFADMIAISQITPGPIAINMATYVGFTTAGSIGSIIATIAVCMPAMILVCMLMKVILKYNKNAVVKSIFTGLRPAVTGLIAVAAYKIATISKFNLGSLVIAGAVMFSIYKFKLHPIIYILLAGVVGAIFM